jgi:hypothetical protein
LGVANHGGIEREKSILLEKSLSNLDKDKEKKRVSDIKGFRKQNNLDLKCF